MMKFSQIGRILEKLYTDKMMVWRYHDEHKPNGSTESIMDENALYADIPCRISFSTPDKSQSPEIDVNPINHTVKIFCGVNADVKKGDYIKVQRIQDDGTLLSEYDGNINEPAVYTTHKELMFKKDGEA